MGKENISRERKSKELCVYSKSLPLPLHLKVETKKSQKNADEMETCLESAFFLLTAPLLLSRLVSGE